MTRAEYLYLQLRAGRDRNGNTRRGYLVLGGEGRARPIYFTDDAGELEKRFPHLQQSVIELTITPKELKELARLYG